MPAPDIEKGVGEITETIKGTVQKVEAAADGGEHAETKAPIPIRPKKWRIYRIVIQALLVSVLLVIIYCLCRLLIYIP